MISSFVARLSASLLEAGDATPLVRMIAVPFVVMAVLYGVLLVRGPFDRPAGR